jgi:hypothetical protein
MPYLLHFKHVTIFIKNKPQNVLYQYQTYEIKYEKIINKIREKKIRKDYFINLIKKALGGRYKFIQNFLEKHFQNEDKVEVDIYVHNIMELVIKTPKIKIQDYDILMDIIEEYDLSIPNWSESFSAEIKFDIMYSTKYDKQRVFVKGTKTSKFYTAVVDFLIKIEKPIKNTNLHIIREIYSQIADFYHEKAVFSLLREYTYEIYSKLLNSTRYDSLSFWLFQNYNGVFYEYSDLNITP